MRTKNQPVKLNSDKITLKKNETLILSSSLNKDVILFYIKGKKLISKHFTEANETIVYIQTLSKMFIPANYSRYILDNNLVVSVEIEPNNIETYKVINSTSFLKAKKITISIDPKVYHIDDEDNLSI